MYVRAEDNGTFAREPFKLQKPEPAAGPGGMLEVLWECHYPN
jgi:hypothetical protein